MTARWLDPILDRLLGPLVRAAKADALREAAVMAERDACACPKGCVTALCAYNNRVTAAWLRELARATEGQR